MKVILRSDITNVGRQGDVKEVAAGFARNYLLPRRLAMEASPANLKVWEREKVKLSQEREKIIAGAKEFAEKIEKLPIVITVKVGEAGKLFGSVTTGMLARAFADNGLEIEKHSILLAEPIKEIGEYTVDIRLHPEVIAKSKISVVEEKQAGAAAAEEAPVEEGAPAPEAKAETTEEQK